VNLATFFLNHFHCLWYLQHVIRASKETKQIEIGILIGFEATVVPAEDDKVVTIHIACMSHSGLERLPLPFAIKLRLHLNDRVDFLPLVQEDIKYPDVIQRLTIGVLIFL